MTGTDCFHIWTAITHPDSDCLSCHDVSSVTAEYPQCTLTVALTCISHNGTALYETNKCSYIHVYVHFFLLLFKVLILFILTRVQWQLYSKHYNWFFNLLNIWISFQIKLISQHPSLWAWKNHYEAYFYKFQDCQRN